MTSDMQPQGDFSTNVGHQHEKYDVGIRGIFFFGLSLVIMTVVVQVTLAGVMELFGREKERETKATLPVLFANETGLYPAPKLQESPALDVVKMHADEAIVLSGYGWVDPKAHIARIPIDRAMDLLAAQGLPTREPKATPKTGEPTTQESKSGSKPESRMDDSPLDK
ncbi:MAG: hypothetical protein ABI353_21845 [Isosphaeraceae bacterium]